MLELRPTCEACGKDLLSDSLDARICSFECTFCVQCVETILFDVCPNCGGGFSPRPIRPRREHRPGAFLGAVPASALPVEKPVNPDGHAHFAAVLKDIPPQDR